METTVVNSDMNNETQQSNGHTDTDGISEESETTSGDCIKDQCECESFNSHEPEPKSVNHHDDGNLLSVVSHDPLKCPAYTYHQTIDSVTFILHVPVVKETTLVKSFEPQQVSFVSVYSV